MQIPYRKPGKFSQIPHDPHLTSEKVAELERKLEKLKNISQPQAAAEVSRLAELGDFSENAEYQLAKGRLRGINNTITKLEYQIHQAVIIPSSGNKDTVSVGCTVAVEIGGKQKKYQLLGSSETNPEKGIISHNSPIGSALVGCKVGDKVTVRLASKEVIYTILTIE